jgi:hypothetical protein
MAIAPTALLITPRTALAPSTHAALDVHLIPTTSHPSIAIATAQTRSLADRIPSTARRLPAPTPAPAPIHVLVGMKKQLQNPVLCMVCYTGLAAGFRASYSMPSFAPIDGGYSFWRWCLAGATLSRGSGVQLGVGRAMDGSVASP